MDKLGRVEKRTNTYVDIAFRMLQEKPGVKDVIIINQSANPVRTTMDQQRAVEYCGYYDMLYQKVRYIMQHIDPEDELLGFRLRTTYDETLVTPDGKITIIVIQNATNMSQALEDVVRQNRAIVNRLMEKTHGFVIVNNHYAMAIKSTIENSVTQGIIKQIAGPLVMLAKSAIRDLDPTNDLQVLRIGTKKREYLVAPEVEFTIVVIC